MARSSRSRGSSQARRTNWLAHNDIASNQAISAGGFDDIVLADAADPSSELSKYVGATLIRMRGQIVLDPDFSASNTASESCHVWCSIYVAPDVLATPTNGEGGYYSSDRILWIGAMGWSQGRAIISGADSELLGEYSLFHPQLEIDVKAMRKLEDDSKIILRVVNTANASAVAMKFGHVIRMLIKE